MSAALAATAGSAFAAETFDTLNGIKAESLNAAEMGAVVGRAGMPEVIHITPGGTGVSFVAGRGEPQQLGAPPGIYVNGANLNGG